VIRGWTVIFPEGDIQVHMELSVYTTRFCYFEAKLNAAVLG